MTRFLAILKRIALLLLPVFYALAAGALLILAAGANPFTTYGNLFIAGFSCNPGAGRCALVTALTFATPLILAGLSAAVSLRAGFFSLGQAGQMMVGAAAATWIGSRILLPAGIHPAVALLAAMIFGALWALIPALLKEIVGVNEIISTFLLNPLAGLVIGIFPLGRLSDTTLLLPIIPSTKFTVGFFIALAAALIVFVYLWHTTHGLRSVPQPRHRVLPGTVVSDRTCPSCVLCCSVVPWRDWRVLWKCWVSNIIL